MYILLFRFFSAIDKRSRSKYPLACIEKMLNIFGADQGGGFDCGCQIETTLKNSALGDRAAALNFKCLVDAFHGHAHNRLCQLSHLTTYMKGLGIEDLGVCERAFSRSNGLGGATRYMSVFHRMQAIAQYFKDTDDLETYQNLCALIFFSASLAISMTSQLCSFGTTTNRHYRSSKSLHRLLTGP
jgi:hypothetical protein